VLCAVTKLDSVDVRSCNNMHGATIKISISCVHGSENTCPWQHCRVLWNFSYYYYYHYHHHHHQPFTRNVVHWCTEGSNALVFWSFYKELPLFKHRPLCERLVCIILDLREILMLRNKCILLTMRFSGEVLLLSHLAWLGCYFVYSLPLWVEFVWA
jgi:hypothetical protein